MALTAALAVLLIGGSVGVTLAVRSHRAAPAAQTVVISSTTTSTTVLTTTSTAMATSTSIVRTTLTPPTSPARVIGSGTVLTTPAGPQVTCANGTKTVKGTCTSYTCWSQTTVTEQRCPALTGQAGLTWIFRTSTGAPRPTCAPVTDKSQYAAGEIEVVKCTWSDLSQVSVFLSRWKDVASGLAFLTANYGAGGAWVQKLDGKDERQGLYWNVNPPGKNQSVNAELYDHAPYSLLAIVNDPNGAGKGQWPQYFTRQGLEYQSRVDLVLASTK